MGGNKRMNIHFVGTGNTFRSRLAEAHLRSKNVPDVEVSSSGIKAHENKNGPITWYAARLIKHFSLVPHMSFAWTKTSPSHLKNVDIVIFMDKAHHHHSQAELGFRGKRFKVWDIPDLEDLGFDRETGGNIHEDAKRMKATEQIFDQIKRKVDTLTISLSKRLP